MIPYIHIRCVQWADWYRKKEDNGLGFPSECCYTRWRGKGPPFGLLPSVDEAAWEIHQAVKALSPRLNNVVTVFYLGKGTADQKAADCGCHRDTLYDRLHMAQVQIMDWLNAEAAGIGHGEPAKKVCIPPTVSV
jgi:DNA-directed RNA polymerase specialized sigma24 family protein